MGQAPEWTEPPDPVAFASNWDWVAAEVQFKGLVLAKQAAVGQEIEELFDTLLADGIEQLGQELMAARMYTSKGILTMMQRGRFGGRNRNYRLAWLPRLLAALDLRLVAMSQRR